jgi:ppGpp synthetase/RelA/SpoT-type nucleotidyltranferase
VSLLYFTIEIKCNYKGGEEVDERIIKLLQDISNKLDSIDQNTKKTARDVYYIDDIKDTVEKIENKIKK